MYPCSLRFRAHTLKDWAILNIHYQWRILVSPAPRCLFSPPCPYFGSPSARPKDLPSLIFEVSP